MTTGEDMGGSSVGSMIKLTSSNYSVWKPMMGDLLYCLDLYDPIAGDSAKPENITDEKWAKLNRKTLGTIRRWVDISVFHHVSVEIDAKVLWEKLEDLFERKTAQNKTFTIRKLVNLKLKVVQSVSEHLNDFQARANT